MKIITDYTYALDLLDEYDHQRLKITDTNINPAFTITYEETQKAIIDLSNQFKESGEKNAFFGKEKDQSLKKLRICFIL